MSTLTRPSRRRILRVLATLPAAALPLGTGARRPGGREASPIVWRGRALGAEASIVIEHPDPGRAGALLDACRSEVLRLERIFSLYRSDSSLRRLNRAGGLERPPPELVELLSRARGLWELTGGAFDATVQPLWEAFTAHYASRRSGDTPLPPERIGAALARVGMQHVEIASGRIELRRPAMALTLNGIAQGYLTDRLARRLQGAGFRHVLVDMGELRALGPHADGRPWRVGVETPRRGLVETVGLDGTRLAALATSAGAGTPISPDARVHHLFDPRSGQSTHRYEAVSVLAGSATLADGLSTGFSAMGEPEIRAVVGRLDGVRVWLFGREGTVRIG